MRNLGIGKTLAFLMGVVVVIAASCDAPPATPSTTGGTNTTTNGGTNNGTNSTDPAGSGRVRLLLGDKAFPFDLITEACVYVSRIEFRRGDECEEAADCSNTDLCMESECIDGTCVAAAKDCDDADACTDDSCDEATGDCVNEDVVCDAGDVCVDGACATSCTDAAECDDTDGCTDDDCVGDVCVHTPKDCDDSNACTNDSCEGDGMCVNEDVACAAGEICVEGDCISECVDATECDDGDLCTDDDCVADLCVNTAIVCDDGAYCNGEETCDTTNGVCVAGENPCDEDDFCDEENQICDTEDGDDDDEDSPFVVVFTSDEPMGTKFNLLELQNGTTALLADATVPAGTYTQVRVIVVKGEISLVDGRTLPLTVPSGAQSGIKLRTEFEVEDGSETTLLLHVDVTKAFQPIPGGQINDASAIRNFHFRPSLAMDVIDLGDAGSISGTVTTNDGVSDVPLENATVSAMIGTTVVRSTSTEADGTYQLIGLLSGTYDVEFAKDTFDTVTQNGVSVTVGMDTASVDATLVTSP